MCIDFCYRHCTLPSSRCIDQKKTNNNRTRHFKASIASFIIISAYSASKFVFWVACWNECSKARQRVSDWKYVKEKLISISLVLTLFRMEHTCNAAVTICIVCNYDLGRVWGQFFTNCRDLFLGRRFCWDMGQLVFANNGFKSSVGLMVIIIVDV